MQGPAPSDRRLIVRVRGAVQGVGFRPFVYRLGRELGLRGSVLNDPQGVVIDLEGAEESLQTFLRRLPQDRPALAVLHEILPEWQASVRGVASLEIEASSGDGGRTAVILPDVATCADCLREMLDPDDRRHAYAFLNCTHCGPRFSIVRELPYDRPNTTMAGFRLCPACGAEYGDPADRRFHAQPTACEVCGPTLTLVASDGARLASGAAALEEAAQRLLAAEIVAMKGLGGFHLLVDARDDAAVARLRQRKGRPHKPLAIMVVDIGVAERLCELPAAARQSLLSPAAPCLLLRRRPEAGIAATVAPDNPRLGLMLAYTPLHHLLLRRVGIPLVATSGNVTDEPICIDNDEARDRLGEIADVFLVHDRPIARHVDDSVAQVHAGSVQLLRRARGYAPLPVNLPAPGAGVLAVGAHLKNVVALGVGSRAFLSQHIGDMQTPQAIAAFERVIEDFLRLYEARPAAVAHDLHPDYFGSRWAVAATAAGGSLAGARTVAVQHHHAHLASCLADNDHAGPALGIVWDGTGLGPDATVWGGEFLVGDFDGYERVAALRPFRLPGGDAAVRQPARVALALAWQLEDGASERWQQLAMRLGVAEREQSTLVAMLERGLRSPWTTSAGRLFDGIAALAGLRGEVTFEGQAAMALEAIAGDRLADAYPMPLQREPGALVGCELQVDWRPAVRAALADCAAGESAGMIARRFHAALVEAAVAVAVHCDVAAVALSGGCFQNRLLSEATSGGLQQRGFDVLVHHEVPPNDGGISLGQLAIAAHALQGGD